VRRYWFAGALLLATLAHASADVRIRSSPGGEVGTYLKLSALVRESGERIIIDGPCLSAARWCSASFHAVALALHPGQLWAFMRPWRSTAMEIISRTRPRPA
jgi:hypothetical protein